MQGEYWDHSVRDLLVPGTRVGLRDGTTAVIAERVSVYRHLSGYKVTRGDLDVVILMHNGCVGREPYDIVEIHEVDRVANVLRRYAKLIQEDGNE